MLQVKQKLNDERALHRAPLDWGTQWQVCS